ncbi:hypothetical protein GY45DRAFT_451481 [Cubamyces sp. BRFM 1775]|nr:hypothetical protein GY45DRAFT_451481 [Cubamyces sp. BRFM 1775]
MHPMGPHRDGATGGTALSRIQTHTRRRLPSAHTDPSSPPQILATIAHPSHPRPIHKLAFRIKRAIDASRAPTSPRRGDEVPGLRMLSLFAVRVARLGVVLARGLCCATVRLCSIGSDDRAASSAYDARPVCSIPVRLRSRTMPGLAAAVRRAYWARPVAGSRSQAMSSHDEGTIIACEVAEAAMGEHRSSDEEKNQRTVARVQFGSSTHSSDGRRKRQVQWSNLHLCPAAPPTE